MSIVISVMSSVVVVVSSVISVMSRVISVMVRVISVVRIMTLRAAASMYITAAVCNDVRI